MILAQEQAEIDSLFEDFKNFIQMRAKSKLRESTFETYVRHLKILFLNHELLSRLTPKTTGIVRRN